MRRNLPHTISFIFTCNLPLRFPIRSLVSLLIGYSMPVGLPMWRVHASRLCSIGISVITITVPFNLRSLATPCLRDSETAEDQGVSQRVSHG